jgi:hypothetical protein
MTRLKQHSGWDPQLEDRAKALLTLRYSESSSLPAYEDFAQACQRPDGSVYGTTGQCRKGKPITLSPEEGMPVLYKKAVAAGLKGAEVKAIADQVREKFGIKQIKKGPELQAVFAEVKKRLGEDAETAPAPKAASVKPTPAPKPKSEKPTPAPAPKPQSEKPTPAPAPAPAPKESIRSESPASAKTSRVSDERLKETFNRAVANEKKLEEKKKELQDQGKKWDDPEYRALNVKVGRAHAAVELTRQAYHAVDRDAFLRGAGEQKKLRDQAQKLEDEARKMVEKDGLNPFNTPANHPSKALQDRAQKLRLQANDEPRDRMHAAFYGEPSKISKAPSDGGGKVDAVVPTRVPRGGADKDLKDFLDGAEPVMAFNPKGFAKFVKEGEAKNGFEAGTGGVKKGKSGYLEGRKSGEEAVLGISKTTDAKGRPVYAALEHPDRSRSLQGGSGEQMSQYGGVQVIFNNSVKDRATFTIGDSLNTARPRGIMASPVRDPANPTSSRTTIQELDYGGGKSSGRMKLSTTMDEGRRAPVAYVEAQIHGGLRTSDIKEVRYYKGHDIPPAARKALEKQGVRIVELPPQMSDLRVEREHPGYSDIQTVQQFWK